MSPLNLRDEYHGPIDMGSPFAAAREIGMSITEDDLRWWEIRNPTKRETFDEILWCEPGAHEWAHPRMPGRRLRSCPDHAHLETVSGRDWPGRMPQCFLLRGKWFTRIFVTATLLRGSTWHIPTPIGDALDVETESLVLNPAHPELGQSLKINRRSSGLSGGSLATALRQVDVMEGDFAFVALNAHEYELFARRQREKVSGDALGSLLWGCGLDPTDTKTRDDFWQSLSRVLGGVGADRESIRQRLLERGNTELVTALDGIRIGAARTARDDAWGPGWELVMRLGPDERLFSLETSGSPTIRIAIGVSTEPVEARDTTVDTTGVVWVETNTDDSSGAETPPTPSDVVLANPGWVRWKRAEHHALRTALAGTPWLLEFGSGSWHNDAAAYVDLADALASVSATDDATDPTPPLQPPRTECPRSGFAYDVLARRATARGLRSMRANTATGFEATFEVGNVARGAMLADVLREAL
jgi:hypothetical protein